MQYSHCVRILGGVEVSPWPAQQIKPKVCSFLVWITACTLIPLVLLRISFLIFPDWFSEVGLNSRITGAFYSGLWQNWGRGKQPLHWRFYLRIQPIWLFSSPFPALVISVDLTLPQQTLFIFFFPTESCFFTAVSPLSLSLWLLSVQLVLLFMVTSISWTICLSDSTHQQSDQKW